MLLTITSAIKWGWRPKKQGNNIKKSDTIRQRTLGSPRFHLDMAGSSDDDDELKHATAKEDGRPVRFTHEDVGDRL